MEFAIGNFEGPLDLLLALVRKEEMDIMSIDIHQITKKYLQLIQNGSVQDLKEGGEFIQMAAVLLYIKSRSLLPQELEAEAIEEEGPAQEDLAQALVQHSAYLKAAERLNQRPSLDRDIWTCAGMDFAPSEYYETQSTSVLLQAFRKILKQAYTFSVKISFPSVSEWIFKIQKFFIKGQIVSFKKMVQQQTQSTDQKNKKFPAYQVLLSFLSLLELGKLGVVSMVQKGQDIQIQTHKTIDQKLFQWMGKDLSFQSAPSAKARGAVL